jgi:hypothetical protein
VDDPITEALLAFTCVLVGRGALMCAPLLVIKDYNHYG